MIGFDILWFAFYALKYKYTDLFSFGNYFLFFQNLVSDDNLTKYFFFVVLLLTLIFNISETYLVVILRSGLFNPLS